MPSLSSYTQAFALQLWKNYRLADYESSLSSGSGRTTALCGVKFKGRSSTARKVSLSKAPAVLSVGQRERTERVFLLRTASLPKQEELAFLKAIPAVRLSPFLIRGLRKTLAANKENSASASSSDQLPALCSEA